MARPAEGATDDLPISAVLLVVVVAEDSCIGGRRQGDDEPINSPGTKGETSVEIAFGSANTSTFGSSRRARWVPALARVTPSRASEDRAVSGQESDRGFQPPSMRLQGLAAILRLTSRRQEGCMTMTERSLVQVVRRAAGGPPTPGPASTSRSIPRLARIGAAGLAAILIASAVGCGADESRSAAQQRGTVKPALKTLRSAFEAGDPAPILATFDDDVQLHSPALMSPPDYRGPKVVGPIVTLAMRVIENVRVTDLLDSSDALTGAAIFEARIGG